MAVRTTAAEVKKIMDTGLADQDVKNVIEFASRMVDQQLSTVELDDVVLKDIETWLTAHLLAVGKERQALEEDIGNGAARVKYQGNFTEGLRMTTYGQMVIMLDTSGTLEKSSKKKAKFNAIPQFPEDYE